MSFAPLMPANNVAYERVTETGNLETLVRNFHKRDTNVILVANVHVGEQEYYKQLMKYWDSADLVLLENYLDMKETVTNTLTKLRPTYWENRLIDAILNASGGPCMQKIAQAYGLTTLAECTEDRLDDKKLQTIDIEIDTETSSKYSLIEESYSAAKLPFLLLGWAAFELRNRIAPIAADKRELVKYLGPDSSDVHDPVTEKGNHVISRAIKNLVDANQNGALTISVITGSAHCAGVEPTLVNEYFFEPKPELDRWYTAIRIGESWEDRLKQSSSKHATTS